MNIKVTDYYKQLIALIKGDKDEYNALRIARKADAAIDRAVAEYKGEIVELEDKVENAKQSFQEVLFHLDGNGDPKDPKTLNPESFRTDLVRNRAVIQQNEKALKEAQKTLKFFEDLKSDKFSEITPENNPDTLSNKK